jgi:hypothetical protein
MWARGKLALKLARQSPRTQVRGGKSGLHRAGCRLMTGRREAMESATENTPPMAAQADQVRLKWRGKSSPRWWQHQWQGKPHPEQDQICRL